jgi:hypothetical protein
MYMAVLQRKIFTRKFIISITVFVSIFPSEIRIVSMFLNFNSLAYVQNLDIKKSNFYKYYNEIMCFYSHLFWVDHFIQTEAKTENTRIPQQMSWSYVEKQ